MEINRRNLKCICCAVGIVMCVMYWIPKLENGEVELVFKPLGVQTVAVSSTQRPLVVNSTTLVVNSTVSPLGFLDFRKDSDTLKQLITRHCKDDFLVPPLVHYVWLSKKTMFFHEYVGILSASKFLKPCYILIHGDTIPGGKWWDNLVSEVNNIIHVIRQAPDLIFGQKVRYIEHKADIMRLEILLEYGGIYTDTDIYFLRSFDPLRNNELTLCRESVFAVANGLLVANKESVLLKMWYITYHNYNASSWEANSVHMANRLCKGFPELVHMEPGMIVLGPSMLSVYKENIPWDSKRYSVHLYARYFENHNFEIAGIRKLNTTFGALTRFILFGKKVIRNR